MKNHQNNQNPNKINEVVITTPYISKALFAKHTGFSLSLVNKMVREGTLLHKKTSKGPQSGVWINMLALTDEAIRQIKRVSGKEIIIKLEVEENQK